MCSFFLYLPRDHLDLHSFPTRRSSDLTVRVLQGERKPGLNRVWWDLRYSPPAVPKLRTPPPGKAFVRVGDRKSTRLNSSHTVISYAVFCLKKKTQHSSTHLHWEDRI